MKPSAKEICANCGQDATKHCERCTITYYCNSACQKTHWLVHKQFCAENDLDRIIQRAGRLLKDIVLLYCERTCWYDVTKVERFPFGIVITCDAPHFGLFYKFRRELFESENDIEMALTTHRCTEALACFHDLIRLLLEGTRCNVSELAVSIKQPVRRALRIPGPGFSPNEEIYHTILKVASRNGQKEWILDPTGVQVGISPPVMGYLAYLGIHAKQVEEIVEFGACKRHLETKVGLGPLAFDAVRPVYGAIAEWQTKKGITLPQLLREADATFGKNRQTLIDMIRLALDEAMTKADYFDYFNRHFGQVS